MKTLNTFLAMLISIFSRIFQIGNTIKTEKKVIFANIIFVMTGRIPSTLHDFDQFIRKAFVYINTEDDVTHIKHGIRLGLDTNDLSQALTYKDEWFTGDPAHPGLWDIHTDPETTGKKSTKDVENFVITINKWFHPLLDICASSKNINSTDREVLHIAEVPETHHRDTAKIAIQPDVSAHPGAPGVIELRNRHDASTGRPGLPEGVTGVEVTYACYGGTEPGQVEILGQWKATEPLVPTDCAHREPSSSAVFNIEPGPAFSGMKIKGWTRYIDTHNKTRAGDWGNPFQLNVP